MLLRRRRGRTRIQRRALQVVVPVVDIPPLLAGRLDRLADLIAVDVILVDVLLILDEAVGSPRSIAAHIPQDPSTCG